MVVGDAELAQGVPLGGAGGGEDLGAEVAGELDRGHADAAGAGVDQHLLAGLQAGEVDEAVVGGEEDDRHRRRLREGPALGDLGEQVALGDGRAGRRRRRIRPITRSPGARSLDLASRPRRRRPRPRCRAAPRPG